MEFIRSRIFNSDKVLDMGTENRLSVLMRKEGYAVTNTGGEDLDRDYNLHDNYDFNVLTAFEILEHFVNPAGVLKPIHPGVRLIASVPIPVWFAKSYSAHFHEFEPYQFDWLLNYCGFKIIDSKIIRGPDKNRFGLRPYLRYFSDTYYFVMADKVPSIDYVSPGRNDEYF